MKNVPTKANPPSSIWSRLALVAVLLLNLLLSLWGLGEQEFTNSYYAAAVQSMGASWHNFFFVSFDAAGFLSVDKPPLGLWLAVASVKLFGLSHFSLALPAVVAGLGSILVLYQLVRRAAGETAGLFAALILIATPVWLVVSRNTTLDSIIIFLMLSTLWLGERAVSAGRLLPLLSATAVLGLGFNVKMFAAYLVLPALYLSYLLFSRQGWRGRVAGLSLASVVLVVTSFCWLGVVDLTPAGLRPYVGSSQHNSAFELSLDYNGLARLDTGADWRAEIGEPGPLRLFDPHLAGQASWLLPFALISLILLTIRWRELPSSFQLATLTWGSWLILGLIFFCTAHFFHRYYLALLAPAVAALTGIGLTFMWQRQHYRWLAVAVGGTAVGQVVILHAYTDYAAQLTPIVLGFALFGLTLLVIPVVSGVTPTIYCLVGRCSIVGGLLLAPLAWSVISITPSDPVRPYAGPQASSTAYFIASSLADPNIVTYLVANRQGSRFLAASFLLPVAAAVELQSGEPVMAVGGYNGTDPIITSTQLAEMVAGGEVRYFLLTGAAGEAKQAELWRWVKLHCPPARLRPAKVANFQVQVYGPCHESGNLGSRLRRHYFNSSAVISYVEHSWIKERGNCSLTM